MIKEIERKNKSKWNQVSNELRLVWFLKTYLVGVSFPFCVLLALAWAFAWALLLDVIGEITADFPVDLIDLLRCEPIVLANNANWPRRAPAVLSAVNIFCCCTDRLFTCELFNCHDCTPWRDTFNRLPVWLFAFCTDDNDGNIMIGDGLRSILINFNPLKCSTIGFHTRPIHPHIMPTIRITYVLELVEFDRVKFDRLIYLLRFELIG